MFRMLLRAMMTERSPCEPEAWTGVQCSPASRVAACPHGAGRHSMEQPATDSIPVGMVVVLPGPRAVSNPFDTTLIRIDARLLTGSMWPVSPSKNSLRSDATNGPAHSSNSTGSLPPTGVAAGVLEVRDEVH